MVGRNQEVNLSAVVLPADANLTVFYWWIGEQLQVSCFCWLLCVLPPFANPPSLLQPTLTLRNSLLAHLDQSGKVSITVQASNGRSMVQDTRTVRVYGNQPAGQPGRHSGSKDGTGKRKLGEQLEVREEFLLGSSELLEAPTGSAAAAAAHGGARVTLSPAHSQAHLFLF